MKKTVATGLGLIAFGLLAGGAQAATTTYTAALAGPSEVPPTTSSGKGMASVMLDTATKKVTYDVSFSGLTGPATAAHIHCPADPGANAGVAVPLAGTTSPLKGTGTMTDAQVSELQSGKCYVNVHTAQNKGGEIRGQLKAQ